MKKIYILLIAIFIGNIANAQNWQSLGPSEFNQASFCDVEYTSIVINGNGVPIIAFRDYCTGNLNVKNFYGNNWLNIGNIDTSKTVYEPSMVIDSSGTLYVAYGNSTNGKVNVIKFNGNNWVNVGSPDFSSSTTQYISITLDGNGLPYIVYSDFSNMKKATVMKFNGINWVNVGSPGFTSGQADYTSIDIDNNGNPYIVYSDYGNSKKATVMKYNGTNWVNVGTSGFSVAQASFASISITNSGTPYIVYSDYGNSQKATVMKYNGNSWVNVGSSGFSAGGASHTSIVFDTNGTPYVVYYDIGNGFKAIVKRYNGNIWETVGSSYISNGQVKYPSIAFDGSGYPFIVYSDYSNGVKATLKKFNGSSWIDIGNTSGLSTSSATDITISVNRIGIPYVVYSDYSIGGKASVMKFDGSNWVYLGSPGFSAGVTSYTSIAFDENDTAYVAYKDVYNSGKATVMKFNGNNWVYVGSPGFSTGSLLDLKLVLDKNGIPYVVYRDLATINSKATVMKYNGINWINVGISGFSASQAYHTSIALDSIGTPYVAYSDYANNYKAVVKKFNGNSWVDVGNYGISTGGASYTSIKVDKNGTPYVAFQDGAKATVMKYNGSTWLNVGNPEFSAGPSNLLSLVLDSNGTPYVVFRDDANGAKATVMKYNGNNWVNVGISGFSAGPTYFLSLALDSNGTPYVAHINGSAWVYKFNVSNCINPISGGAISSNQNICIGTSPAILSNIVSPIGFIGSIDFKWQKSITSSNSGFIDIPSSNLASYNPSNITQTTWFKRLSKVSCDTLWSNASSSNVVLINIDSGFTSQAGLINGMSNVYKGQNNVIYTVPLIANATSYVWTLPSGATGSSTTNSISVNYSCNSISGNISVYGVNSCGNGLPSILNISVGSIPQAGTITGLTTVCNGQNDVTYIVPSIPYSTSYIWSLPNGVSGMSNTNTITVSYGVNSVSGVITVKGANSCEIGVPSSLAINVNPLPNPAGTISGTSTVCQGQTSVMYSVPAISNATFYVWSLPPGVSGTSSNNTITVSFDTSATSGNISVYGVNSCGNGTPSNLAVLISSVPNAAGSIIGLTTVCQGQNNVIYTVPSIANTTSYIWTLPNGATGTSNTNSITINYGASAVSGNIIVKGINSCGNGLPFTLAITVNPTPSSAGTITGQNSVCPNQSLVSYTIPAINNATSYNWTLPTGAMGTSSTNSIIVDYGSNALSGNIAVCGNNTCGNSNASALPITVNSIPLAAGSISGSSSVIAGQQNVVYSVPAIANATSHNWDLPIGTSINYYTGPTISINYSQSATSGNIIVNGNNVCGDGPSSSLYITVNPFVPNCSAQFDLVADTALLHHYFVVNNASGVPPLQYNWSWGDGTYSTTTYPTHTYSAAGYYNICLTIIDSVGCTTTYCDSSYLQKDPNAMITVSVIPQGTLGISNLSTDKFKIYPNPAKDNLIVELVRNIDLRNNTISFYNIAGQLIKQLSTKQTKTEIDIHDFPAGVYLIKINNEKESFVKKFIKE